MDMLGRNALTLLQSDPEQYPGNIFENEFSIKILPNHSATLKN